MPVKILLVEDDAVDQMAFKRAVQKEQLDYDYKMATSVSEAKAILKSEQFDILLLDFNLGDGTAADIFPSINDTPFIVATGSGDEAKAVIAMKAGAYDYLVKDPERNYLKTLPYLVENAIKRKQTEKSLHEKEIYLQTVYDKIFEGIVTVTPSGQFESLNISAEVMFGYSQSELIGKSTDILLPDAFFISDNGPGIEEKDFDRIFKIFQKAHQKEMPESTGVGLTIAKKIVEKSGGRIWLESKVGEGTTFYFTIPAIEHTADISIDM